MSSSQARSGAVDKKYSIAFVLSTSVTTGGGTEQFVLNMVKNAPPSRFSLSVVQTDMQDAKRLDDSFVASLLRSTRVYTIRSFRTHLAVFERPARNAGFYWIKLAVKEFVTYLLAEVYRVINSSVVDLVRDSDIIYFVRNDDLVYLRPDKRTLVLGSTHSSSLTLGSKLRGLTRFRVLLRVLKYRRIDGFHFTSLRWQDKAVLHKKYDFLLPLGTDARVHYPRDRLQDKQGNIKFLFVSRLEPEKGVVRLLDSWKLLKLDTAELHIAGTGSLSELVKAAADSRRIIYHGVLSNEGLANLYRDCDVFVFPTHNEIYGLVVLEALASGLFAIVSDELRGNFDEFERMGMLEYVRNDPTSISASMTRVALCLGLLNSQRLAVYEYIRADRDWSKVSRELYSIFEKMLPKNHR